MLRWTKIYFSSCTTPYPIEFHCHAFRAGANVCSASFVTSNNWFKYDYTEWDVVSTVVQYFVLAFIFLYKVVGTNSGEQHQDTFFFLNEYVVCGRRELSHYMPMCVLLEQTEVDSLKKKKKKFPAVIFVICAIIIIQAFILVILA